MRFAVPEGTVRVAVKGMQFLVEHGTIEAPDHCEPDLIAHGCLPVKAGPIVINTQPPMPSADDIAKMTLGTDPLPETEEAAQDAPPRPNPGRRRVVRGDQG